MLFLAAMMNRFRPFSVEGILGRGGSGVVYAARTQDGTKVALKVLHADQVAREGERFLAEADRLRSIDHPSVVKVVDAGRLADDTPYLAMERLQGQTLAQRLEVGALTIPAARAVLREVCAALDAVHAAGMLHRDIKPENVFLAGRGAVLIDFGIARHVGATTVTLPGVVYGSPSYMAPERFFGQPATIATEVYEVAVTLYAMIAGRLPWEEARSLEDRLSPPPLAGVPAALDLAIRRALSTRADNRPPTMLALLASITEAAMSPEVAIPVTRPLADGRRSVATAPTARGHLPGLRAAS